MGNEFVEYGNGAVGLSEWQAAQSMAGSLRDLGPRDWLDGPRLVRQPAGGWGWYAMARKPESDVEFWERKVADTREELRQFEEQLGMARKDPIR